MRFILGIFLSIPLLLLTYGTGSMTVKLISGQLGRSPDRLDAVVVFIFWWVLVVAWLLVLPLYKRRHQ